MSIDLRLLEILEKRRQVEQQQDAPRTGTGGGKLPPDGTLGPRVTALEASVASIHTTLAVISEQIKHLASREDLAALSAKLDSKASTADLATLAGKIDRMASATDLAELKGRVARIPTVPVLVSIGILVSLMFAAASWALRHLPPAWTAALQ